MKYIEAIEEAIGKCYADTNGKDVDKAMELFREFVEEIEKIRVKCIDEAAINRMYEMPIDLFNEGIGLTCAEILLLEMPND